MDKPFYPSHLIDGGYDVDDYRDVDPRLGTLADFDDMLQKLHENNIKVYVDLVPNHSSNSHVWFKEAINSDPQSSARARYIFRDGRGANGELPPTDWPSHFAPSAWTHESRWVENTTNGICTTLLLSNLTSIGTIRKSLTIL